MKINRVNIICLGVRDMEKSLAFYKNIGFKTYVKDNNPPIVFFDNQGTKLELYSIEGLAKDINAENPPAIPQKGFCGITLAINMKSKKEVNDFMEIVRKYTNWKKITSGKLFIAISHLTNPLLVNIE